MILGSDNRGKGLESRESSSQAFSELTGATDSFVQPHFALDLCAGTSQPCQATGAHLYSCIPHRGTSHKFSIMRKLSLKSREEKTH